MVVNYQGSNALFCHPVAQLRISGLGGGDVVKVIRGSLKGEEEITSVLLPHS